MDIQIAGIGDVSRFRGQRKRTAKLDRPVDFGSVMVPDE